MATVVVLPRTHGRSGRGATWRPELFRVRRLLAKGRERLLRARASSALRALCERPGDRRCLGLKESFRAIHRADDRAEAEVRLAQFLAGVERQVLPAFSSFAEGVRAWREELLTYLDEPTTNGFAEGVINKVKVIKRRAYGLPSFAGFRRRVLVACG